MTILRKLTLKISAIVVRFASPGCKDWAEGLLQEAALIENDWSALAWALGSTKLLLDRREAPFASLADASTEAHKFVERQLRQPNGWWMFFFIEVFTYLLKFFGAKNWSEHTGCAMVALASLFLGTYHFFNMRRINKLLRIDMEDEMVFYQGELRRSLTPFPGGWILLPSTLVFAVGVMLSQRGGVEAHPVMSTLFTILCLLIVLLTLRTRRRHQRRLAQLEALQTNHF